MDIVTSIPVRAYPVDSITPLVERLQERIARRAYENFVARGCMHGHDVEDWLQAERRLITKLSVSVRKEGDDIFVSAVLPEIDPPNLAVHIAPRQLFISSDIDESDSQIGQVIDLPFTVLSDGVDAEQTDKTLRIAAAVAEACESHLV